MMNKVLLIGNLTHDPDLTATASGVSVCHFSIAVNRSYTTGDGERETDFFNCTAWRGLAENVAKHCKKGNKVAVSGSVQMRTYEDNHGQRRTTVDVIVQDVEFLMQRNAGCDDTHVPYTPGDNGVSGREPATRGSRRRPTLEAFDDDRDISF